MCFLSGSWSLKKEVCQRCYKDYGYPWDSKCDTMWDHKREVYCCRIPNSDHQPAVDLRVAKIAICVDDTLPSECDRKGDHE